MVHRASVAISRASSSLSPWVMPQSKSGNVTTNPPSSEASNNAGYSMTINLCPAPRAKRALPHHRTIPGLSLQPVQLPLQLAHHRRVLFVMVEILHFPRVASQIE